MSQVYRPNLVTIFPGNASIDVVQNERASVLRTPPPQSQIELQSTTDIGEVIGGGAGWLVTREQLPKQTGEIFDEPIENRPVISAICADDGGALMEVKFMGEGEGSEAEVETEADGGLAAAAPVTDSAAPVAAPVAAAVAGFESFSLGWFSENHVSVDAVIVTGGGKCKSQSQTHSLGQRKSHQEQHLSGILGFARSGTEDPIDSSVVGSGGAAKKPPKVKSGGDLDRRLESKKKRRKLASSEKKDGFSGNLDPPRGAIDDIFGSAGPVTTNCWSGRKFGEAERFENYETKSRSDVSCVVVDRALE